MTTVTPTIGGEPITIGEFSAYKAIFAMEIVSEVESAFREVMSGAAEYKRRFEAENFVEMSRAEARRQFRPQVLIRQEETDDGRVAVEPMMRDGEPVLGPDPLGHLADADWAASGQVLRIPESPSQEMQIGAMVPLAFKLARTQVLRLVALAMTPNRDLEAWDGERDIAVELDRVAREMLHRAKADELVRLAVAVAHQCREQLAGPFEEATAAWRQLWPQQGQDEETEAAPAPEPMRLETEPSDDGPTSSTESPDDTAGRPTSSSTEPASVS